MVHAIVLVVHPRTHRARASHGDEEDVAAQALRPLFLVKGFDLKLGLCVANVNGYVHAFHDAVHGRSWQ